MNTKAPLREGFTTGTAATAAAMAALHRLLSGESLTHITVPLPPFDAVLGDCEQAAPTRSLIVPVLRTAIQSPAALAEVEKDGGDDPDATRHVHIIATVECTPQAGQVDIEGGAGVGRVTLPGLGLAVGMAAINPVPRQQICRGLRDVARTHAYKGGLRVHISVPGGEALARYTLNGRLGIVGGISILGTQGTVKPFSHEAWQATIVQGLEVAHQTQCPQVCLSTGRRSEKLLMARYPHLPAQAFIQAADFVEFSLQEAGKRPFEPLVWGCFFGKLLKLAEGHPNTHARNAELDMQILSRWCEQGGALCAPAVARCVTAGHALEHLLADSAGMTILRHVAQQAAHHAQVFAGRPVRVHLFHIQGQELLVL